MDGFCDVYVMSLSAIRAYRLRGIIVNMDLKKEITAYLQDQGADLVGFTSPGPLRVKDGRVSAPYRPEGPYGL